MKSRAFYVLLRVLGHVVSEGVPATTADVIAVLIVALRAWGESAPARELVAADRDPQRRRCSRRRSAAPAK